MFSVKLERGHGSPHNVRSDDRQCDHKFNAPSWVEFRYMRSEKKLYFWRWCVLLAMFSVTPQPVVVTSTKSKMQLSHCEVDQSIWELFGLTHNWGSYSFKIIDVIWKSLEVVSCMNGICWYLSIACFHCTIDIERREYTMYSFNSSAINIYSHLSKCLRN